MESAEAASTYILTELSSVRELVLKSQVVIFGDLDSELLSRRLVVAVN